MTQNKDAVNAKTAAQVFNQLCHILETGKSELVKSANLGEVSIDVGKTGKSGYGLKHIIEQRFVKDGMNDTDIAVLLYLIREAIETGDINTERIKGCDKIGLEKNGILAVVKKATDRNGEKFVLSGYALNEKMKDATDAIQTVSAHYGYTSEFSDFRKQVGAVVASLGISDKPAEKSSGERKR